MYYCICLENEKSIIEEIKTDQEKNISVQDLLKKHNLEKKLLWIKTPFCAYSLNIADHPFTDRPELILKERPSDWDIPSTTLFIFTNFDQNSTIFYLTPKHNTKHNIPRLTIVIPQSEFQSNLEQLYLIVESTFSEGVKVDSILENDKALGTDTLIKDIYEKLKAGNEIIVSLQISEKCDSMMNYRVLAAREVLDSELRYVNDLNTLETVWMKSFKEQPIFGEFHFKTLFQEIPKIHKSQRKIYSILKSKYNDYATEFGRTFLECVSYFELSIDYISHYSDVNQFLESKKQDPEYIEFCESHMSKLKGRDFDSYLVTPVQRMSRYHLLLRELKKSTPINHPDFIFVDIAYNFMHDFNQKINKITNFVKEQRILTEIQVRNYADFKYVTEDRTFLKRFDVINETRNLRRSFIICNDYIFLVDSDDLLCRFKSPSDAVPVVPLNDGLSVRIDPSKVDDKSYRGNDVKFPSKAERTQFLNLIKRIKF